MAVEDIGARRWAEVDAPDRYRDRPRLASSIANTVERQIAQDTVANEAFSIITASRRA
jgi:hypothetical protein